jgi:hypothetical protein
MNRLKHSPAGYRRRLQIGTAQVVFITEGKTDRYFYSKLFDQECRRHGLSCNVRIARELPGNAGGKKALLKYFDYLRRQKSLCSTLGSKITAVIFLLDKDIDERRRRCRRSIHTIYTEGYDYENYIFANGDLVEAGAAAAGLDIMSVRPVVGDTSRWIRRVADEWRDWVKVCVFSLTRRIIIGGNYGVCPSPINHPPYGGVDHAALSARLQQLEQVSGLSSKSFRRSWNSVSRMVDQLYSDGREHEVFKGKWFAWFLAHDLTQAAAGRDANLASLEKRLAHHVAMTVDYSGSWGDELRKSVQVVLRSCELIT